MSVLHQLGLQWQTNNHTIQDPGTGNTFKQDNIAFGKATVGAGTYKLPDGGLPMYVQATGAVTIQSAASTVIATLASGQVALVVPLTATTWAATILDTGVVGAPVGTITIPLMSITGETGVVLAAQNSTTSGWTQLANKNIVLNIPVNATNEAFSFSVSVPADLDASQPVYVDVLATKAADNDALTLDCELYAATPAEGVGADLVTTSAQTIEEDGSMGAFTCSAPGDSAYAFGGVLTLGGTNDGDAVYIHGVRIRYTRMP